MDISLVIEQLRRYCPELGGRVGGAADFENGVETVITINDPATGKLAYPSAVVIPLEDEPGSNDLLDGNLQEVTETIGVIVMFDASADRRGQAAVSQVEAMKYAMFRRAAELADRPRARRARTLLRRRRVADVRPRPAVLDVPHEFRRDDQRRGRVRSARRSADQRHRNNSNPTIRSTSRRRSSWRNARWNPAVWDEFDWDDGSDWQ